MNFPHRHRLKAQGHKSNRGIKQEHHGQSTSSPRQGKTNGKNNQMKVGSKKFQYHMASDNDQNTDHKTSQKTWKTSLLLQTDTGGRTNKQPNISGIQWKIRSINRSPNRNPDRLWIIISGPQQNQTLILLPRRKIKDIQHNPERVAIHSITNKGCNTKIGPRSYALKGKPQISKVSPERSSSGKRDRRISRT